MHPMLVIRYQKKKNHIFIIFIIIIFFVYNTRGGILFLIHSKQNYILQCSKMLKQKEI